MIELIEEFSFVLLRYLSIYVQSKKMFYGLRVDVEGEVSAIRSG